MCIRDSARARLPLFIAEVAATAGGAPAADALVMARVLTAVAWQGLTGFTLPARPSDCPPGATALSLLDEQGAPRDVVGRAFAELARELAGAGSRGLGDGHGARAARTARRLRRTWFPHQSARNASAPMVIAAPTNPAAPYPRSRWSTTWSVTVMPVAITGTLASSDTSSHERTPGKASACR